MKINIGSTYINKRGEKFRVIERIKNNPGKSTQFKIQFIETGYTTIVYHPNINTGSVIDRSKKDCMCKYKIGQIITNKNNVSAKILDIYFKKRKDGNRRTVLNIQFIPSGYIRDCNPDHFMRGMIKDCLSPTVHGWGMLGYTQHLEGKLRDMSEYSIWADMVGRCYTSTESENRSYINAEVCERWRRFDYFLEDIIHIEGYQEWKAYHEKYPDKKNEYELDKDTKILGNKVYSPEMCRFIHKIYNAGFNSWASDATKLEIINKIEVAINETARNEGCIN